MPVICAMLLTCFLRPIILVFFQIKLAVLKRSHFCESQGEAETITLCHQTRETRQAGQELCERLQGESQALLECALAAPATLRIDGIRVDRLCSLVGQLLSHGLQGKGVPSAGSGWLPSVPWQAPPKPSALGMLQVGPRIRICHAGESAEGECVWKIAWMSKNLCPHLLTHVWQYKLGSRYFVIYICCIDFPSFRLLNTRLRHSARGWVWPTCDADGYCCMR